MVQNIKTANVVIIGGGIIGTAIASALARDITGVVLIEKEGIAAQASGANYGIVDFPCTPGFTYRSQTRSLELYEELDKEHFDVDIEFEKVGGLRVGFTPAQYKAVDWYCRTRQEAGIPIQMLDGKQAAELEPHLSPAIATAIYCDKDTQLNPYMTTMAFANLAKRRGAAVLSGTEARKINMNAGRVVSVDTSAGTIQTSSVIVANGYMSRPLVRPLGINLPIFPQRLQSLVTEPTEKLLTRVVHGMRYLSDEEAENDPQAALEYEYKVDAVDDEKDLPQEEVEDTLFAFLRPTLSGTIVLGTTSEFAGIDRRTTPRGLSAIIKEALKICPALINSNIIRTWAALIPFTFDSKPILGKVPDFPGLYIAAGHPHAMSHAPAVGEVFSALFLKENSMSEYANFIFDETRITRFPNWSR